MILLPCRFSTAWKIKSVCNSGSAIHGSDRIASYTEGREVRNSFPCRQLSYYAKRLRRYVQLPQAMKYASHKLKPTLGFKTMCVLLCQAVPPPTLLFWYLKHAENIQVEWPDSPVNLFHMSYLIQVNRVFLPNTHSELWRDIHNLCGFIKKCKSLTICSRLSSLLNSEMSQLLSIWREAAHVEGRILIIHSKARGR